MCTVRSRRIAGGGPAQRCSVAAAAFALPIATVLRELFGMCHRNANCDPKLSLAVLDTVRLPKNGLTVLLAATGAPHSVHGTGYACLQQGTGTADQSGLF